MSNHLSIIYKQISELSCQQQLKTGSRVYSQVFLFATFPGKMLSCIGDRKEARSRRSRQSLEYYEQRLLQCSRFWNCFVRFWAPKRAAVRAAASHSSVVCLFACQRGRELRRSMRCCFWIGFLVFRWFYVHAPAGKIGAGNVTKAIALKHIGVTIMSEESYPSLVKN